MNVKAIKAAWRALVENIGELSVIRSAEENERAAQLLDALLEVTGAEPDHPLAGLVDLVSDLVEAYESERFGEPEASPADVLRMLMETNELKQSDLAEEFGGQSVVSAVLNGHRKINAKQAGVLAARFNVSAALFIEKPSVAEVVQQATEQTAPVRRETEQRMTTQLLDFLSRGSQSTDLSLSAPDSENVRVPKRAFRKAGHAVSDTALRINF